MPHPARFRSRPDILWMAAGLATGLMCLQKPSGVIFGAGMGLWALLRWWSRQRTGTGMLLPWRNLLVWGSITALVLSPYVARNLLLFGRPVFSTESYDAWILGFQGSSRDAWEDIYKIYFYDELPNRSWILRWGWDRTFNKIMAQATAAWNFILPSKDSLLADPKFEGSWFGIHLSALAPVWLSLLGLVTLRPRQRPLVALVGVVTLLYIIFLATYWHADEERYFLPLVPWLLLLAMAALCGAFDRAMQYQGGRWAGLAGGLATIILWSTLQPNLAMTEAFLDPAGGSYWARIWKADLDAYAWLKTHTRPDDVIMTRVPWQLSFHADRPSLMIPNAPLTSDDPQTPSIMQVAHYYGADYLVMNAMQNPGPLAREGLKPLSKGGSYLDFELVYTGKDPFGGNPIYIYRFPTNYAGAVPLRAQP